MKKSQSITTAKTEALFYLDRYKQKKDYSDIETALNLDNTNISILYYYLSYLKKNDEKKFDDEIKKYKYYLDEDSCSKLNIKYIDHKKDIFVLLEATLSIESDKIIDIKILKDALIKCYSKEDKEILERIDEKRINNLPLDDIINNDIIFYLTVKIQLGYHLHSIASFNLDENNSSEVDAFKKLISHMKIYSEILKHNINNNQRILVFNLVNILDLNDYWTEEVESLTRLNYYLKEIKLEEEHLKLKAGILYADLVRIRHYHYPVQENMDGYKNLFFETIEKILKSKCIKQLVNKMKAHNSDKTDIISIDNYYIDYIKNNIIFYPFFNDNCYGLTITLNGKIIINDEFRYIHVSPKELELYNFCLWIVTGVHEIIGHFLKDYFYYLTGFAIPESSPKKKASNETKEDEEGGYLVEEILFSQIPKLYLTDVLYILDINNWNKDLDEFSQYFKSEKRKQFIENGIKSLETLGLSEECVTLLSKFSIEKGELLKFKTNEGIDCRKGYFHSQPYIDLSKRICINNRKKFSPPF